MKRFLTLAFIAAAMLCALPACGCDDGADADLIFVNGSNAAVVVVLADFTGQGSVAQAAGSSPLRRGESFGFESGKYPVTVAVYDRPLEDFGREQLARLTLREPPAGGERWYVTARDGAQGLTLTADTRWPDEV